MALAEPEAMDEPSVYRMPGECRIDLPRRKLGHISRFGWLGILLAAIIFVVMVFWITVPLAKGINKLQAGQFAGGLMGIGFAALSVFGIIFAIKLVAASIGVINDNTRASILIKDDLLTVTEYFGRFRWKRSRKLNLLNELVIENPVDKRASDLAGLMLLDVVTLKANLNAKEGEFFTLLLGYPKPLVYKSAKLISDVIEKNFVNEETLAHWENNEFEFEGPQSIQEARARAKGASSRKKRIAIVDETVPGPRRFPKPDDSKIDVADHSHAQIYTIGPNSFAGNGRGLLVASIIWLSLTTLVTVVLITKLAMGDATGWETWAGLFAFWIIGFSFLAAGVNKSSKVTTIGVSSESLWIQKKSKLGERVLEIPVSQISEIDYMPKRSQTEDEEEPTIFVKKTDEKNQTLVKHLGLDEMRWLTAEINFHLELPRDNHLPTDWAATKKDIAVRNPAVAQRVRVEESKLGKRIFVPRANSMNVMPILIGFGVVFLIGVVIAAVAAAKAFSIFGVALVAILIGLSGVFWVTLLAMRCFEFEVDEAKLTVRRVGVFGQRSISFLRGEGLEVRPNFGEASERPYYLIIKTPSQTECFLFERSRDEIQLVAATLNLWLEMPLQIGR